MLQRITVFSTDPMAKVIAPYVAMQKPTSKIKIYLWRGFPNHLPSLHHQVPELLQYQIKAK